MSKVKKHPGTSYRIIADPIKAGFENISKKELSGLASQINDNITTDYPDMQLANNEN